MADAPKLLTEQWAAGHKAHVVEAGRRVEVATRCLRLVSELVPFDDVVDFGCGIGAWLAAAKHLGACRIVGFEGDYIRNSEVVVPRDAIRIADLSTQTFDLNKQHTLAISIEVAEHLPPSAADGFVRTLVLASDFVLFSAAIPNQGGIGHINEQPLMYWVKRFWDCGYIPLDPIRPRIQRDKYIFPWIRQNIVLFANYDVAIKSSALMSHARPLPDFRLHYAPQNAFPF